MRLCLIISKEKLDQLDHSSMVKASELRYFLLYYGPFILKNCLPSHLKKYLNHFMKLHVAIRILCNFEMCVKFNKLAEKLLIDFVQEYGVLYGRHMINHNVILYVASFI